VSQRVLLLLDDCGAGDAIRVGSSIRQVRESLPGSELTLVVGGEAAPVYRDSPLVDRLIVSRLYLRPRASRLQKLVELCRLAGSLGFGYDLVVIFWWGSTLLRVLARIVSSGRRVGYSGRFQWLLSSRLGGYDFSGDETAQQERLLVAAGIGGAAAGGPELAVTEADAKVAAATLQELAGAEGGPLVLLHPGSDWACQQWLPERWSALADGIAAAGPFRLAFTGSSGDGPLIDGIQARMSAPSVSLAGRLSLAELAALLRRTALLVTVDSAVFLLARAEGTPVLVLAGPSHPERVGGAGAAPMVLKRISADQESWILACKKPRYPAGGCQDWSCPWSGLRGIEVADALLTARLRLRRQVRAGLGTGAQVASL